MKLDAQDFELPGKGQDSDLKFCYKRYRPASGTIIARNYCGRQGNDSEEVVLLFAHCVSTHKETWEPTIEHFLDIQTRSVNRNVVKEAWVVDAPNHGQAAVVNEHALLDRPQGVSSYDWARAFHVLFESEHLRGAKVIGVGHSGGSWAITLATVGYPLHQLPYIAIILIEAGMMTREMYETALQNPTMFKKIKAATMKRKDIWPSRDAARQWFSLRLPWKRWDTQVLQLLVDEGLRELPTLSYPDQSNGFTLKLTREQDTASYDYQQHGSDCLDRLSELCPIIPVHCILGTEVDAVPEEANRCAYDESKGRRVASNTRIQGAGHLVVQEKPFELALAMWKALNEQNSHLLKTSKL
ncbi:hypothetical protein SERLA73DRAFT_174842 [Serpula lacrymans var. lacrymans S7.3]|uniref:AB hydrolase-1 domain-containing protein n=2 Tax=Serpula lacrymans var. lacrymans TaxID=341189 RepID=F8PIK4_SERL3|nr:uncharacterized protein SERLADRAFT_456519 [Serpula lacrymans var. lacrymans S7.9]EGO03375.1 hypothetical protein SERLA73DRAFT_174842 [Serpula lacrymans var. lacrymans S7.3]EGO29145.1 hypothetical protein SERLADRAFT_456519 [Serpula lacrymans var. lacrymans S7.9]